jgi:hypothetical protein
MALSWELYEVLAGTLFRLKRRSGVHVIEASSAYYTRISPQYTLLLAAELVGS